MTHLWVRAETRANEARAGLVPQGVARLREAGFCVTVEASATRALPIADYAAAGADIAPAGSWRSAPRDAFIFGLKELPDDSDPLRHRHIMFGHAFKGQAAGARLLQRFRAGGGSLLDLEYLTDDTGRRVAAFGYWAGFAGAALSLMALGAQARGADLGPVARFDGRQDMISTVARALDRTARPHALVIGALGRVGTGAADLCAAVDVPVTRWDMAETAHGGPFPEVLEHDVLLNCILALPGTPAFVPADAGRMPRALRVIGDIACDPGAEFSPIRVYDQVTDWNRPVLRVHAQPPLDVMAIDNLPALMPMESSHDFAAQMLPLLLQLPTLAPENGDPVNAWTRAEAVFRSHLRAV